MLIYSCICCTESFIGPSSVDGRVRRWPGLQRKKSFGHREWGRDDKGASYSNGKISLILGASYILWHGIGVV